LTACPSTSPTNDLIFFPNDVQPEGWPLSGGSCASCGSNGPLYNNGGVLGNLAPGTNNQALMGNTGAAPSFRALVGADLPAGVDTNALNAVT
jgi:hypothetical protein